MKPYYQDDLVTLYHGDFREVNLPRADAVVTDPPYGETSLTWDTWPHAWPSHIAGVTDALWCFGSFRMFMDNIAEFSPWKFSHEVVWEKQNGSGFATDKFRRVHELATFWYRSSWSDLRHEVPRVPAVHDANKSVRRNPPPPHTGEIGSYSYVDDGLRMTNTVIRVQNEQGRAVHPTQKPEGIVAPLIEYSVPLGGLVLDPFAGSGTTLLTARNLGRRAVGVEINEAYCEAAARRLSQQAFDFEGIA